MGIVIEATEPPVFGRLWVARRADCYAGKRRLDPGFYLRSWERP